MTGQFLGKGSPLVHSHPSDPSCSFIMLYCISLPPKPGGNLSILFVANVPGALSVPLHSHLISAWLREGEVGTSAKEAKTGAVSKMALPTVEYKN